MRDAVDIWTKFTKFLLTYLILKLVLHLQIFSYEATFSFENNKKQDLILLSLPRKKSQTNENSAKSSFVQKNSRVKNRI